jgi:hypothetical protein
VAHHQPWQLQGSTVHAAPCLLNCTAVLQLLICDAALLLVSSPACRCATRSNLFNKAELAINVLGVHTPLGEAQLLLQLYAAKGLDMLGMLNGQFAFCLYDSKQVRAQPARAETTAATFAAHQVACGV